MSNLPDADDFVMTLMVLTRISRFHRRAENPHGKLTYYIVVAGVPQGSIDSLLLFSLFVNDLILFLYTTVLSNYADDNNLYAIGNDKEEIKRALVKDFQTVINWFHENYMILNTEKCHYMCMGEDVEEKKTLRI